MKYSLIAILAATAGLAALPLQASGAVADRAYNLRTRIVEQAPSVGEYDGSLQMRVSPDGIISGYYRPDDNARFIAVTGGVTGDGFWIDIGALGRQQIRFSGTFTNGNIKAYSNNPFFDNGRLTGLTLIGTAKSSSAAAP